MVGVSLDKNLDGDFASRIRAVLGRESFSSVLCSEPLLKASFLDCVIGVADVPVHYLDFDLLYSGLVASGMLQKRKNLRVYRPAGPELQGTLKAVLEKIADGRSVVIIDSLNGFYNVFDERDSGRLINSYIMLLVLAAQHTDSRIILASIARINEKNRWVLSPTGRQVIVSEPMTVMHIRRVGGTASVDVCDGQNRVTDSIAFGC